MKTYIIYNSKFDISKQLVGATIASCKQFDLSYTLFDGITSDTLEKYFKSKGLRVNSGETHNTPGTLACFVSHHFVWTEVVKYNTPTLILEHDGVVVRDPRRLLNIVDDVCHLDRFIPFNSSYPENSTEYHNTYNNLVNKVEDSGVIEYPENTFYSNKTVTGSCFKGAYGYLLMPSGAQKLLTFVQKHGAFPADKTICEQALHIQRSACTYVRLNSFFSTLGSQRKHSTRV